MRRNIYIFSKHTYYTWNCIKNWSPIAIARIQGFWKYPALKVIHGHARYNLHTYSFGSSLDSSSYCPGHSSLVSATTPQQYSFIFSGLWKCLLRNTNRNIDLVIMKLVSYSMIYDLLAFIISQYYLIFMKLLYIRAVEMAKSC